MFPCCIRLQKIRPVAWCLVVVLFAGVCLADSRHRYEIDPESPDGTLLQQILQESSSDHRRELLERYLNQFPQTKSIAWIEEQLLEAYAQNQDVEHLLALAEKLLALDSADLGTANRALRAASTGKDLDLRAKWANLAWEVAHRAATTPNADQGLVAEVTNFADFVLYTAAHETGDLGKKTEYFRTLEQRDPDNEYVRSGRLEYINAVIETASPEQRLPFVEKELARTPNDEDLLFAGTQEAARLNRDAQALNYSLRLLSVLAKRATPTGLAEADWAKKRSQYISIASWYAGSIYSKQGEYGPSDRYLTAALSYLLDKPGMLAAAYYTLGYNNYTLANDSRDPARVRDALRYNQLCANIKSPYQASAQKNLEALKVEFHLE